MKSLLLLIAFLLSPILFAQTSTLPFTLTDAGHIMVKATVNGVEGNFVFDTGAGLNMLTKKFADKIKDLEKTDEFYTGHRATGEAITADLWKAKTLNIGPLKSIGSLLTVIDIDFPLDGLISLTLFKNTPVTIDYTNKVLRFESDKDLKALAKKGKLIPIQISNEHDKTLGIYTYVKLNNKLTLQVALDSGAGFNVYRFNSRYMVALGIDPATTQTVYRKSDFKPTEGNNYYGTTAQQLSDINNTATVKDFKITFIEGLIEQGITCVNWLGNKITIDIKNERLIVE
jgi:hypothetical protein